MNLPPMKGGLEALKEMDSAGYSIWICGSLIRTSRYCAQEKWEWVRKHLGEEWLERLILCTDKTTVRGDILIDDHPHLIGSQTPLWEQVLFDAPYNQAGSNKVRLCS